VRFSAFRSGDVTGLDALVLLIWLVLALVPIFQEVHLLGFKFKQDKVFLNPQPHLDTERESVSELTNTKLQEVLKKLENQMLVEQIEILKIAMNELKPTQEEKENLLYRLLAGNQITVVFERTNSLIFGSQLSALQYLNGRVGVLKTISELRPFYEKAKAEYPQFYETYPFESWWGFLSSVVLIVVKGGNVEITIRGQEFLKYLINQRYTLEKGG